ncbi:MAG: VWA domain-containing protein [Thauera sp.]|nr:VWA domain-containing protein [Thauera sp.]
MHWVRTLSAKGPDRLAASHLRYQAQPAAAGWLHCVLLDCSASMFRDGKLSLAKRLLLELCEQNYRSRRQLAVIAFAGDKAELLQPPARAAAFNEAWISALGGGGGSPLSAALELAEQVLARAHRRQPGLQCQLWLISDFRLRQLPPRPTAPTAISHCTLIDCEQGRLPLGRGRELAAQWQAEHLPVAQLWTKPTPRTTSLPGVTAFAPAMQSAVKSLQWRP